jgi:hypothetical protein
LGECGEVFVLGSRGDRGETVVDVHSTQTSGFGRLQVDGVGEDVEAECIHYVDE